MTAEAADIDASRIQQGDTLEGGNVLYTYNDNVSSINCLWVYLDGQEQNVDSGSNREYYELPTGKDYEVEKIEFRQMNVYVRYYTVYLNTISIPTTDEDNSNNSSGSDNHGGNNNNGGNNSITEPEEEITSQVSSYYQSDEHTHSFSWVTVQEAGVGQDGLEEYRCACGLVEGRNTIPGSQAVVSQFKDMLVSAPMGEKISFDSGRFYTMSDSIIKKLAQRNDVSAEITFEYKGKGYKMTIPAGVDYTAILEDEENFYGYFYFAQLVGAVIEEI